MNFKSLVKMSLKIILFSGVVIACGCWLRAAVGKEYFLADAANLGWIIGVIGTIYTLIAAFVLFGVWNQYNALDDLIAREARLLAELWNYTDYFNDPRLDKQMKASLLAYIDAVQKEEVGILAKNMPVENYSQELIAINEVIDKIKFDDDRDATIFPVMIALYRDLFEVRHQRNTAGVTRLPISVKVLFIVLSVALIFNSIILGFVNGLMYIFGLAFVVVVVALTYEVVQDMDNPFGGLFELKPTAFEEAKKYIKETKHNI